MKLTAVLVGLLIVSMVSAASGITVINSNPTNIITHSDGTFTMVVPNQLEATPLEAGDVADNQKYIVVQMSNGVWELVLEASLSNLQSSSLEATAPLEAVTKLYSTAAECSSNCATYANNYCGAGGGWNIQCLQYSTTGINRKCSYECRGNKCTSASDCEKGAQSCIYGCRINAFACSSSGACSGGTCGTSTQCGKKCTSDDDAKTKCIAAYAGSSRAVLSATCSNNEPICKTAARSGIACSSVTDPKCKTLATASCTYGVSSSTCNMEKDCQGKIYASNCEWSCNHPPTTQVCGDKKCTGTETKSTCPGDCGTPIPTGKTCCFHKDDPNGVPWSCTETGSPITQCTGGTCLSGVCSGATRVDGKCNYGSSCNYGYGSTTCINLCSTGNKVDTTDSSTKYLWDCVGANGGTTAKCEVTKPVTKVDGSCKSSSDSPACYSGVVSETPDSATRVLWDCVGANGGTTAKCVFIKPSGYCLNKEDCQSGQTCGDVSGLTFGGICTGTPTPPPEPPVVDPEPTPEGYCGDTNCGDEENEITCAGDCYTGIAECGNTICDAGEDDISCSTDCPASGEGCIAGAVGELYCDGINLVQDYQTATCEVLPQVMTPCPIACDVATASCVDTPPSSQSVCPNAICESDESPITCLSDCPSTACGDGLCLGSDTNANCPLDCKKTDDFFGGGGSDQITSILIGASLLAGAGIIIYFGTRTKPSKPSRRR